MPENSEAKPATPIAVDLTKVDTEALINELAERDYGFRNNDDDFSDDIHHELLETAAFSLRNRNKADTLYFLEQAIPALDGLTLLFKVD